MQTEPLTFYAFLLQRPHDAQPWPVIFASQQLAENEPYRVSEIATVCFKVADDPAA